MSEKMIEQPVNTKQSRLPNPAEKVLLEDRRMRLERNKKDLLEEVNFELLQNIFKRISDKSMALSGERNFVDKSKIVVINTATAEETAKYDLTKNEIVIRYNWVEREAKRANVDPALYFLKVLCHEEVHATAKRECETRLSSGKTIPSSKIKGGYMQHKVRDGQTLFRLFDEGVTEKLSREVIMEYCKSAGVDAKELEEFFLSKPTETPYGTSVLFVDFLIKKISDIADVDEKTVWEAIIRGQRQGEDLLSKEFKSLFREIADFDFLHRLANANSDYDLIQLMSEMVTSKKSYFDLLKEKIIYLLKLTQKHE